MPRTYDREFKLEAIRMAQEPGATASQVERRLGIGQGVLSRWKRQLKGDTKPDSAKPSGLNRDDSEVRRLRRENERLRRERDILKKAVAIFSEDPHRYSGS